MTNELKIIEEKTNFQDVYENIVDIVEEIPFWNSDFQNQKLMINTEWSTHRWFRTAWLHILDKLNALKEAKASFNENEIEVERKKRKIKRLELKKPEDYDLDIGLLEIQISKIENSYSYNRKLVKDAIAEINSVLPFFNSIGKLTKEQFESKEEEHYLKRLSNQLANKHESLKSLNGMWFDLVKDWEQLKLEKVWTKLLK